MPRSGIALAKARADREGTAVFRRMRADDRPREHVSRVVHQLRGPRRARIAGDLPIMNAAEQANDLLAARGAFHDFSSARLPMPRSDMRIAMLTQKGANP